MIFGDFADQRSLMVSPEIFRRVLKPVLADFVSQLRALRPGLPVLLHSDGNLFEVLGDLIECSPEAVRRLVRGRIGLLGRGGGFILAPSNSILPDTPPENVLAVYQEAGSITSTSAESSPA